MEWIDVNDQMPEPDEIVLVAHRKATLPNAWSIDTAYYWGEDKKWIASGCEDDTEIESEANIWFVYYWRPLPEPPIE